LPEIIAKKILKTMNKTIGSTSPRPNPANKLFTSPAIELGFKNNYKDY